MSARGWWGSDRTPRQYAEAIMAMDCKEKRRKFFEEVVPEHLKGITRDHCVTAQQLGGGTK